MSATRMRVGLLTQWYDPEPGPAALPGVLARGLAARGHDVRVLTGFPNYPTGALAPGYRLRRRADEVRDGVHVRRVALYPSHDRSAAKRTASYASFGASALVNGLAAVRDVDVMWVNYSPITVAWPMWAARYGMRIPQMVHVLDLWPDTVLAAGFGGSGAGYRAAAPVLGAWCAGMYRSAASVAYISPGVGRALEKRGVPPEKLHYVPMWADEPVFRPSDADLRAELEIAPDDIVLLYAGALGEAQGLSTLIDACARVTDERFVCLIAGSGVAETSLRARAEDSGARNVRFIGRLPQESMTSLMATCDLSYVGLRPHSLSGITMPSKTQAALAAGRAVLAAAEGDLVDVVRESGAGFTAPSGDPSAVAAALSGACRLGRDGLAALGARGREYYERTFSAARGVERIETLLADAVGTRRQR